MKVTEIEEIDDCYESSFARDIYFDKYIDPPFIFYLADLGKLVYNDQIARPYFKVIVRGKYTIKGAVQRKGIRVLFPDDEFAGLDEIIEKINNYED